MTLGAIIERIADNVKLRVVIGMTFTRVYDSDKDFSKIFDYLNCEVTMINTSEDGTLIVNVKEEIKDWRSKNEY